MQAVISVSIRLIRVVTEFAFLHTLRHLHFIQMVQRCLSVYEKEVLEVYGGPRQFWLM